MWSRLVIYNLAIVWLPAWGAALFDAIGKIFTIRRTRYVTLYRPLAGNRAYDGRETRRRSRGRWQSSGRVAGFVWLCLFRLQRFRHPRCNVMNGSVGTRHAEVLYSSRPSVVSSSCRERGRCLMPSGVVGLLLVGSLLRRLVPFKALIIAAKSGMCVCLSLSLSVCMCVCSTASRQVGDNGWSAIILLLTGAGLGYQQTVLCCVGHVPTCVCASTDW